MSKKLVLITAAAMLWALPAAAERGETRRGHDARHQNAVAQVAADLEVAARELRHNARRNMGHVDRRERLALRTIEEFARATDRFHDLTQHGVRHGKLARELAGLRDCHRDVQRAMRHVDARRAQRDFARTERLLGKLEHSVARVERRPRDDDYAYQRPLRRWARWSWR